MSSDTWEPVYATHYLVHGDMLRVDHWLTPTGGRVAHEFRRVVKPDFVDWWLSRGGRAPMPDSSMEAKVRALAELCFVDAVVVDENGGVRRIRLHDATEAPPPVWN